MKQKLQKKLPVPLAHIAEIIDYVVNQKHTSISQLAKIWKTSPQNIYRLRDGHRKITVEQANLLYTNFKIAHKFSLTGAGSMIEQNNNYSVLIEDEQAIYGNSTNFNENLHDRIAELKQIIEDKNKIIKLLEDEKKGGNRAD